HSRTAYAIITANLITLSTSHRLARRAMSKTALGLVHAHPIYRQGMHYHIAAHLEFEIAGEASNGQQAIQMVEYANPDIVIMEVDLPGVNGLEVARAIKRTHPDIAVVLLGNSDDRQSIVKAI